MKTDGSYPAMLEEFSKASIAPDDKVRYSENYVFAKHAGKFCRYSEISRIYRHLQCYLFIPVASQLMVGDNHGKVRPFCKLKANKAAGGEEIKRFAQIMREKNPDVLPGYSADIERAYKARAAK